MAFHFDGRIHGRVTPPMACVDYDRKQVSAVYTGPGGELLDANGNRVFAPGETIPPRPVGKVKAEQKAKAEAPAPARSKPAAGKGRIAPAPGKKAAPARAPVDPPKIADEPFTPPQPPDAPPLFDPHAEVTQEFLVEWAKQLDPKVLWARLEEGANTLYGFRPADEEGLVRLLVKKKLLKASEVRVVAL